MKRTAKEILKQLGIGLLGGLWLHVGEIQRANGEPYVVLSIIGGVTVGCSLGALLCMLDNTESNES